SESHDEQDDDSNLELPVDRVNDLSHKDEKFVEKGSEKSDLSSHFSESHDEQDDDSNLELPVDRVNDLSHKDEEFVEKGSEKSDLSSHFSESHDEQDDDSNLGVWTVMGRVDDLSDDYQALLGQLQNGSTDYTVYRDLVKDLFDHEVIKKADGQVITRWDLYLKFLEFYPENEGNDVEDLCDAYAYIASQLSDNGYVELNDGTQMTKLDCYLNIIDLNPQDVPALDYLRDYLDIEEIEEIEDIEKIQDLKKITLLDGTVWDILNVHFQLISVEPDVSSRYLNFAHSLFNDWSFTADGKKWTKKSLLLEAIRLDPLLEEAYCELAFLLEDEEKIEVPFVQVENVQMTKKELLEQVLRLNPSNEWAQEELEQINLKTSLFTATDTNDLKSDLKRINPEEEDHDQLEQNLHMQLKPISNTESDQNFLRIRSDKTDY
ncbi:MAG: hypothetical protein ACH350_08795, partial [Parachlamydiaceae bacterium]